MVYLARLGFIWLMGTVLAFLLLMFTHVGTVVILAAEAILVTVVSFLMPVTPLPDEVVRLILRTMPSGRRRRRRG